MNRQHFAVAAACLALLFVAGCAASCQKSCGGRAGVDGRSFAGMKYNACCEQCGGGFACGTGSNCGCGGCQSCGDGCGSAVTCGSNCSTACAACCQGDCEQCVGDGCGCRCRRGWWARFMPGSLYSAAGRCKGCGPLYWSPWYNDPPACCEPCDYQGNFVGPGAPGYYRAPYLTPQLAAKPLDQKTEDVGVK